MPILAWRTDADGYMFENSWTFDARERAALSALVALRLGMGALSWWSKRSHTVPEEGTFSSEPHPDPANLRRQITRQYRASPTRRPAPDRNRPSAGRLP